MIPIQIYPGLPKFVPTPARNAGYPVASSPDRIDLSTDQALEELASLRELASQPMEVEERRAAIATLDRLRAEHSDPLVHRMANFLVEPIVGDADDLEAARLREGPLRGVSSLLRRELSHGRTRPAPEVLEEHFRALEAAEGPVPDDVLGRIVKLSANLARQAQSWQEHPEESQGFAGWADRAAATVETWWQRGQIQVRREGRPVLPGAIDLKVDLRNGDCTARAGVLEVGAPPDREEEGTLAREILKGISRRHGRPSPGLERFSALDQETAGMVLHQMLDQAHHTVVDLDRITVLLGAASGSPELRERLEPALPRLCSAATEASRKGHLSGDYARPWTGEYYQALIRAFPEAVNEDLVTKELARIVVQPSGAGMVMNFLGRAREWLPTMMDAVCTAPGSGSLPESHRWLLEKATFRFGWKPRPDQIRNLAARLYLPADTKLFSNKFRDGQNETALVLKVLRHLHKQDPASLDGLVLPDTQGVVKPLGEALLDRILQDAVEPDDKLMDRLHSQADPIRFLYDLALPDAQTRNALLAEVLDGLEKEQGLAGLERRQLAALGMLSSMEMAPDEKEKLVEGLRNDFGRRSDYSASRVLDHYREHFVSTGLDGLDRGDSKARLRSALDLLACEYARNPGRRDWSRLRLVTEKVADLERDASLLPTLEQEFEAVKESREGAKELGDLEPRELARLHLLEELTPGLPDLRDRLLSLMAPDLAEDSPYQFVHRLQRESLRRFLELVRVPTTSVAERLRLSQEVLKELSESRVYDEQDLLHHWELAFEGSPAQPALEGVRNRFPKPSEALTVCFCLAEHTPRVEDWPSSWNLFERIADRVDSLEEAQELFAAAAGWMRRGLGPEEALVATLRRYVTASPLGPSENLTITAGDGQVQVGNVRLPIRAN